MSYLNYADINALSDVAFIGGTNWTFKFEIVDNVGSPVDLSAATLTWTLCPMGQPNYPVLTKTATFSGTFNNIIVVELLYADTQALSGKFIQQPIILDYYGVEFRPAQGVVTIIPRIQNV